MKLTFILFSFLFTIHLMAQEKTYQIRTIAFYNVENLFDTKNDSLTFDDDRTPEGKDHWTEERFNRKIKTISKVISEIGAEKTKTSPDIIGICEVENQQVVEALINHENLRHKNYGIIHFDSPDERGIDVALLYKKEAFIPSSFKSHRLLLSNADGFRDYTRDQLVVGGYLDDEQFYFIVNHWPSRSGGEARSKPNRIAAAKLNKRIIDSIVKTDANAKIISMGDLNDDPTSDSLKKILRTKGRRKKLEENDLFNPMERLYKKGIGSLAYRDKWNLFDQLFFTNTLLSKNRETYTFWKANVFNPPYLLDTKGRYKGYPLRTYAGGSYVGGYSDHFPVYMYIIKEKRAQ
ncbi:endonuclease/exonuclease/phosphatase family protein [Cellulophaga baltica]|uniref:endonuclease/exonuclease/phosphatase family protein n=1 Tax=Cellulophaga TaxID=104264 RepID=UPI001C065E3B|nr:MULTISPECIES: endonuclease/exonuclease/phosphatase family protein [Cellulophaga]MBU2995685.1 endonuclease/exonuclease/phosphatase family protein [Cellulophaga baltica]MDO6767079.1 endonuclease/exonuclease/phosphatase family protein [Cellulophaga sp. 1_MG-2023]